MRDHPEAKVILASCEALVKSFFARRCASAEDAEDLSQEAFYAILAGITRFRGESSAFTWVYAICRNLYSDWARRQARQARLVAALTAEASAVDADAVSPIAKPEPPEELLAGPEGALDALVRELRPSERRLFEDFYRKDMRVREIALALGVPEGTVKYRLHELRAAISARLRFRSRRRTVYKLD